ncbi:MAG: acyltransferase [Roseburia sp.]|nr:acyltransferase [Roseburia sp.]
MTDGRKERQLNYEVLRIIAMLMIVCLHYLSRSGLLGNPARPDMAAADYAVWLAEAFCIVAVNVYVLISGYFGACAPGDTAPITAETVIKRPLRIWRTAFFYSVVIGGIAFLAGGWEFDIYRVFTYVFPVVTEHYWFVTSYIILCLFMPFLNAGVARLDRRGLYALILGMLVVFSIAKTVIPMQLPWDKYGYDAYWFVTLYLTGAALRRYGAPFLQKRGRAAAVYPVSVLLIFASLVGLRAVFLRTGRLEAMIHYAYTYNHLLCYTGAIGLFLAFSQREEGGARLERFRKPIELFSGATFGVYLLHEHLDVRERWTTWFPGDAAQGGSVSGVLLRMLGVVLGMYLGCSAIEILRAGLVRVIRRGRARGDGRKERG